MQLAAAILLGVMLGLVLGYLDIYLSKLFAHRWSPGIRRVVVVLLLIVVLLPVMLILRSLIEAEFWAFFFSFMLVKSLVQGPEPLRR